MSMSIAAARGRLQALGVTPAVLAPPSQRHLDRVKELQATFEKEITDIRGKADKRISESEQHRRELVAENRLHKKLLRERLIEERRQADRVELCQRRGFRKFLADIGGTLGPTEQRQWLDEISGDFDDRDNPLVKKIASFLQHVWMSEAIDIRDCADPRLANGTASRKGRWIEIGPLRNLRLCLIALHETGHVVHAELLDYREVVAEDKFHKISVPAELESWRWTVAKTPVWTEDMHGDMTRFLNSYRRYATSDEATAIDQLCSNLNFRRVQLRIAIGE